MNSGQMSCQMMFVLKHLGTDVACERLDVTDAMHSSQVYFQHVSRCKLPAANVTVMLGVRMFSSVAGLSVRRVVVSVDR